MTYYFCLEDYEGKISYLDKGFDVVSMSVLQKETELPNALIRLTQKSYQEHRSVFLDEKNRQKMHIEADAFSGDSSCDPSVRRRIFSGYVQKLPHKATSKIVTLKVDMVPSLSEKKRMEKNFVRDIQGKYPLDPLFYDQVAEITPLGVCEHTLFLPYWDWQEGVLKASHIFEGRKSMDLPASSILEEGFSWQCLEDPLSKLKVTIKAQWVQKANGVVPIGHKISQAFEGGVLATYTGPKLKEKWWPVGMTLQSGRYEIIKSDLQFIREDYIFDGTKQGEDAKQPPDTFKVSFFDPVVHLAWRYEQARVESFTMALENDVGTMSSKDAEIVWLLGDLSYEAGLQRWQAERAYKVGDRVQVGDCLYVCLESHISQKNFWQHESKWRLKKKRRSALPDTALASFFQTDRGKASVNFAMKKARVLMAHGARCGKVTCKIPLKVALGWSDGVSAIDLDTTVCITHEKLPGGRVCGKVVSYEIQAQGPLEDQSMHHVVILELAVSIAQKRDKGSRPTQDDVFDIAQNARLDTCIFGMVNPRGLDVHDIVEDVIVHHPADEQIAFLQRKEPVPATSLRLFLKDLKSYGVLEHDWVVDQAITYSAPCQIG